MSKSFFSEKNILWIINFQRGAESIEKDKKHNCSYGASGAADI